MYDPPGYLWVLTIAGIIGMLAATCAALYAGAVRAGLGPRRAALLAAGAGPGDIAAPLAARRLARGSGRRADLWFNAFGLTDLIVALTVPCH